MFAFMPGTMQPFVGLSRTRGELSVAQTQRSASRRNPDLVLRLASPLRAGAPRRERLDDVVAERRHARWDVVGGGVQ